jgi:hypothetical protein
MGPVTPRQMPADSIAEVDTHRLPTASIKHKGDMGLVTSRQIPADSVAEVDTHRLPTVQPSQHQASGIKVVWIQSPLGRYRPTIADFDTESNNDVLQRFERSIRLATHV